MKKIVFTLLFISVLVAGYSQSPQPAPIDTIITEQGSMLIYPNRTWAYMHEENFSGVMNERLHELVCNDSTYGYKSLWTHDDVITCTTNDVTLLKDTVWMCVLDSLYGNYAIPFKGRKTSGYGYRRGRRHNGVDIDLETGDTIFAAFDGKVRYSQYHDHGFGNLIVLRHYNGLETYYAHCSKLLVVPNQDVKAGDPIGLGGNTGRSTGSHLHFEVRFYDNPIDPELIFDFENDYVKDNLLVHSGIFSPYSSSSYSSSSRSVDRNAKTHRVRSGENLWTIARKYGTSVSTLCRLNGLKETDVIHIGQTLRLR